MNPSSPIKARQTLSRAPSPSGNPSTWRRALRQWFDARLTRWIQAADRQWAEQAEKPAPLSRYY